ncbi:lipoyl synthase [bacterium]
MLKPAWLRKKKDLNINRDMKKILRTNRLHTVCESASCPNISECFKKMTATFMILGDTCTRNCLFCGVRKGTPHAIDKNEPIRIAQAVNKLGLEYVVITCVTRDDLFGGGASYFCEVIDHIKSVCGYDIKIEVLTSDFYTGVDKKNLLKSNIAKIINAGVCVYGHNMETVPRLYKDTRIMSNFKRSLNILKTVKKIDNTVLTKTGFMLGMGETFEELTDCMKQLRGIDCDIITFGQYLAPSKAHFPVQKYLTIEEFKKLKKIALKMGFTAVESGPYVRSSYKAKDIYRKSSEGRRKEILNPKY